MIESFPIILKELTESKRHPIKTITKSRIHSLFGDKEPTPGIYLISDSKDRHLYVGRSKTIAQRVGKDHRSLDKNAANLTSRIAREKTFYIKRQEQLCIGTFL
ncbi:GIY-YIG nuclease family protein [Virgibacillus flavescens]|uniref:GIY-YIG nuclease family protein n=1 Tax=Virgibacillus flavescens TaxID=1611422 RepID=UPI003D33D16C